MKLATTILASGLAFAAIAACQNAAPGHALATGAATPATAEVPATRNVAIAVEGMT